MVAIPNWLLGKHVTACTITGQVVAADGTLTNDSSGAKSLVGLLDSIQISQENDTENIQAMDQRRNNNVIVGSGTQFVLTEILRKSDSAATPSNFLRNAGAAFDYVLISLTAGGLVWTFYGLIKSYRANIQRGKSTGELTVEMVDPGATNPTEV